MTRRYPYASALLLCLLLAAAPALADPPAAISPSNRAEASFSTFAKSWMAKLGRAESGNKASVQNGSYRGFGKDFHTTLRATGNPASPYIGMLQYTEVEYKCARPGGKKCRVASTVPVMEIFRFRSGRWIY
jgi:hypothetical protein